MQFSVTVRNARLDAIETTVGVSPTLEIRSGAAPASCAAADSGTVLATMTLPSDWMSNAAAGAKPKLGTWEDLLGDAAGVAGHYRVKAGATCHIQGPASMSGGGGELILVNTNIAVGQPVTITAFDLTEGNA